MVTTQWLGEVNVITTQEQVDTTKRLLVEEGVASDGTQPKPVGFIFFLFFVHPSKF